MTDPLDRMRAESDWLKAELTLRAEIERLRKERDEARREVCEWVSLATRPNEKSPRHIAEQRGWYIYNQREDNNA